MKLSLEWLSELVDLSGLSVDEIAEKLTVHTAEVEEVIHLEYALKDVVVGRIVECQSLTQGQVGLWKVSVDLGGRRIQSVCGAPNVRTGLTSAVAMPGAVLADGRRVDVAQIHGERSEAVLCSAAELGLGTSHEGIIELPDDLASGIALVDLIAASDDVVDIDNTSLTHRPDLWGQYGFARELAAVLGRELLPFKTASLEAFGTRPAIEVRVDDPSECPFYSALAIDIGSMRASPLWLQRRLHAIGSKPSRLAVDITNYVQFELGQPTHAFDADKVSNVRVARSGTARTFETLDGVKRDLRPEDLLIYNGRDPIAIAGIMGGRESSISPDTRRLLLESANFQATRVRRTSVRLGLRTDASLRYEKKLPAMMSPWATGRVLSLLERCGAQPEVMSRYTSVGDAQDHVRTLTLPAGYMSERAGVHIEDETVCRILKSLRFGAERDSSGRIAVTIPSFRSTTDISIPEDIAEEVMRIYGYDHIRPLLPSVPIKPPPIHAATRSDHRLRRLLAQRHGFVEVQSYGWYLESWLQTIGYAPTGTLNLRNPVSADRRRMRDSLMPNLLQVAEQNHNQFEQVRVFELGRTFRLDAAGVKHESNCLAGLVMLSGSRADAVEAFTSLRAVVDDLRVGSGLPPFTVRHAQTHPTPWTAGAAHVELWDQEAVVGEMGLLPDELTRRVVDGRCVSWFSIDLTRWLAEPYPGKAFVAPPSHPGSMQDFTLLWPISEGYERLTDHIRALSHPLLQQVQLIDLYQPPDSAEARYTFRFEIRAHDRTVTGNEIQGFRDTLLAHLETRGIKALS